MVGDGQGAGVGGTVFTISCTGVGIRHHLRKYEPLRSVRYKVGTFVGPLVPQPLTLLYYLDSILIS